MRITGLSSRIAAKTCAKNFGLFAICCATSSERPIERRSPPRSLSMMLVIADFCPSRSQLIESECDVKQAIVPLNLERGRNARLDGVQSSAELIESFHRHAVERSDYVTGDERDFRS